MNIVKNDVTVGCEHCSFSGSEESDSFDVVVPIDADETGSIGLATLHCVVSADKHSVELTSWKDDGGQAISPSDDVQLRLSAALQFVADQRFCGNEKICPSAVVDIVKEQMN